VSFDERSGEPGMPQARDRAVIPGPECWNEYPCGCRRPWSPEAHRLRPEGLPLRSTLPRSKNVLHDLNEFNPDFLSSKRRSINGRTSRNAAMSLWLIGVRSLHLAAVALKEIAAIDQARETKLKLFASVPAFLQAHPLMITLPRERGPLLHEERRGEPGGRRREIVR
jgi:hypothetical protein